MKKLIIKYSIEFFVIVFSISVSFFVENIREENEKDNLYKSAELLNDKMMKTKAEGKTIGLDRIAVISALNFANDSLNHKDLTNILNSSINERILKLHQKIDFALES
mgnify:CR=1 FL=1